MPSLLDVYMQAASNEKNIIPMKQKRSSRANFSKPTCFHLAKNRSRNADIPMTYSIHISKSKFSGMLSEGVLHGTKKYKSVARGASSLAAGGKKSYSDRL